MPPFSQTWAHLLSIALDVDVQLTSLRFWCKVLASPSISSPLTSPARGSTFSSLGFAHNLSFWRAALWPLCRLSSSAESLAPAWISPLEKPNTPENQEQEGRSEWGDALQGNLTTRCEGVTLPLCSLAAVRAFSERESWTSVCTVACQKSLRRVKSHNICTQRAGHETQRFAFP